MPAPRRDERRDARRWKEAFLHMPPIPDDDDEPDWDVWDGEDDDDD